MDLVGDGQGRLAGRRPRRRRGPPAASPGPSPALVFQMALSSCVAL
jgi:hypothetical protein